MFDNIESIELPPDQEIRAIIKKLLKDPTIFHPRALLFGLMSIDNLKVLAVDIKLNGIRHKIVKTKDIQDGKIKIIDGKNRYIACILIGLTPRYKYKNYLTEIEKIFFVVSENLNRKHYMKHEKIVIAEFMIQELKKLRKANESKELNPINQNSTQKQLNQNKKIKTLQDNKMYSAIATTLKTKPKTIKQGVKILEKSNTDPKFKEQWDKIEKGKVSIDRAYNNLKGNIREKPIKTITQMDINKKLSEELKKTETELKSKGKTQDDLTKKCLFLE